jgi:hypothetical protein
MTTAKSPTLWDYETALDAVLYGYYKEHTREWCVETIKAWLMANQPDKLQSVTAWLGIP